MHRCLRFGLAALIASLAASSATAQQPIDRPLAVRGQVDRLLDDIAAGRDVNGGAPRHVPVLIDVVRSGDEQESQLAMRVLAGMGSTGRPAMGVLCSKLSSRSHASRGLAVDALVAINPESVTPLIALLDSSSSRTRAAAVETLGRLRRLEPDHVQRFAGDSDPRVRVAVVNALRHLENPDVRQLTIFLKDRELSVVVTAARILQMRPQDSDIAVPALIQTLSRSGASDAAAFALAAHGVDARRAVPALIRNSPLFSLRSFDWSDTIDAVLRHIGPPDERDLPALSELLMNDGEEIQILAANSLSLLELKGRPVVPSIEDAIDRTVQRYRDGLQEWELNGEFPDDYPGRVLVASERLAATLWDVTRDADRFVRVVTHISSVADEPIWFSHPTPWHGFSTDDCRAIEPMLRSSNVNVQITALYGVSFAGRHAEPLTGSIIALVEGSDRDVVKLAVQALGAIGPSVFMQSAPIVRKRFDDGTIALGDFARAIGGLEIQSDDTRTILERGLRERDRRTRRECAEALCRTSTDPKHTADLIINRQPSPQHWHRDAITILKSLQHAAEPVIPYLTRQISNRDYWTSYDAIEALGAYGEQARPAVEALKGVLNRNDAAVRLNAAASLLQISGDARYLDQQLAIAMTNDDLVDDNDAVGAIARTGHAGPDGLRFLVSELRNPQDSYEQKLISAIEAIRAVGSAEAIADLERIATSRDWLLRSHATTGLQVLRNPDAK